uniref:Protein CMSS1-like n=1 Tax=Saccoglossus kowalevskii TaxID=10224 RepID=A0ABM0MFT4_SACKO|nr:PREDICTED: protein CMSS1-like [Saccoglossus kowalevskii]
MADDLDDEWWMPKENSDNSDSEIKKTGKNVQIKNTKKRKSVPEKTQPVIQKKRKRRKITDALQRKKPCAADADDFNKILNKEVENQDCS